MFEQAHIVVVDDEDVQRELTIRLLQTEKVRRIEGADSVTALMHYLNQAETQGDGVDLILMDIQMPEVDGLAGCIKVKDVPLFRDIPIIMLTSMKQKEILQAAFEAGANDYVVKGQDIELFARVRAALKLKFEMDQRKAREQELMRITQQLLDEKEQLQKTSYIDELTGIYNLKAYPQLLKTCWEYAYKQQRRMALLLISLDFFNEYNLVYGREQGDQLLKKVAALLPTSSQRTFSTRVEGSVFGVILTEDPDSEAPRLAERICERVRKLGILHDGSEVDTMATVTVGYTVQAPEEQPRCEIVEKIARQALMEGRKSGYNRVARLHRLHESGPFRPL